MSSSLTRQAMPSHLSHRQTVPPQQYAVLLLNDDYTPMDFVVDVLRAIFYLPNTQALAVMMSVHQTGKGICGIYQKDIADTKCQLVLRCAQEAGHPLMCVVEKA